MKITSSLRYALVLSLSITAPLAAQDASPTEALEAQLPAIATPLEGQLLLTGSLAVAHRGEVVYRASYGMANYELLVPNGPDTRFCIASVTKPITALAVARLVATGQLDLEVTVDTWIEGLPKGDKMTLLHLLEHRAGIPHRVTLPSEQTVPTTAAMIVERMKTRSLLFEPGTDQKYSTAGYSIVARIIEIVTDKDYDAALRALIFEPFGMQSTCHVSSEVVLEGRAQCYVRGATGMQNAPLSDLSFLVGGGSLYSTAGDLVRFGIGCSRQSSLPDGTFEVFRDRLGWMNSKHVAWNGKTNQFGAFLDLHLDDDIVVAFTGNAGVGAGALLRQAVPKIVRGETIPALPEFSDKRLSDASAAPFLGDYLRDDGVRTTVVLESGILQSGGGILLPVGDEKFFSPTYGCEVTFDRAPDGRATALVYRPVGTSPIIFRRTEN